jgi:hypothetical protein
VLDATLVEEALVRALGQLYRSVRTERVLALVGLQQPSSR